MAKGVEVVEAAEGAGWTGVAAIYIYCEMVRTPLGIGYMALIGGFGAKCLSEWVMGDEVDTR